MSTTELPPGLPDVIIDKMLLSFSQKLCFELECFTSGTNKSNLQHSTLQRSEKIAESSRALAHIKDVQKSAGDTKVNDEDEYEGDSTGEAQDDVNKTWADDVEEDKEHGGDELGTSDGLIEDDEDDIDVMFEEKFDYRSRWDSESNISNSEDEEERGAGIAAFIDRACTRD